MVGINVKHVLLDPIPQSEINQIEEDPFSYNINLTSYNNSDYQTLTWTNVIDNVSTKCKYNNVDSPPIHTCHL